MKDGEKIYMDKCAACHGEFGESAGRWPRWRKARARSPPTIRSRPSARIFRISECVRLHPPRHAVRRRQSLTNDELYAVTAYVLNLNDIVDDKFVLSKETWGQVKMPNQSGFFDDDRDKTEKAFWNAKPCMSDCRPPVKITGHAQAVDVTPDDKGKKQGGVE